jgi:hypothetical protein
VQVYCQPIQYGSHIDQRAALQFDAAPLAPYAWQPDYFEADLSTAATTSSTSAYNSTTTDDSSSTSTDPPAAQDAACHPISSWKPLAAPQPVFAFDFNVADPLTAFQPAEQQLAFAINAGGVCNAVAFWFDLQLDASSTLSSSPYAARAGQRSTTWGQVRVWLCSCGQHQTLLAVYCLAMHDVPTGSLTLTLLKLLSDIFAYA